jgi:hypothetical protein
MSYCPYQWISDFTYEGLMDFYQTSTGAALVARGSERVDRLLVQGTIDPSTNSVQLQPLFVIPDAEDVVERVPGDYAIVLRDGAGGQLARYPFTPRRGEAGPAGAIDPTPDRDIELLFITELVPFVDGTDRVDIEGPGGVVLHTVTAGSRTPTVTLTSPNGGEVLDQPTVMVSWTSDDPDGDLLSFNVQYSRDNGATYELVAQNIIGSSVELDGINIGRTEQGRFRVLVTDGIHTSSDDSDSSFVVPNRIPAVQITSPPEDVTIALGQTLDLVGEAYDVDSGTLDGEQLQWTSSIDGELGSGSSLPISTLSVGMHLVTLRADDGEGGVAEATVQVTVVDDISELPPVPDRLIAGPSLITLDPGSGQSTTVLSIDNENPESSLSWEASASEPWLLLSATSGTTPAEVTVSLDRGGLAPGRYSAEIVVSSSAGSVTIGVEAINVCTGDCNGDGVVTVDELITGVNIALGTASLDTCSVFDSTGDGAVTVDELIGAVNNALTGCG